LASQLWLRSENYIGSAFSEGLVDHAISKGIGKRSQPPEDLNSLERDRKLLRS
jgi:hypothetical protein